MKKIKRKPRVIEIKRRAIRMVRGGGLAIVKRWYITLRFGKVEEKLAVSGKVVRWLRSR